MPAKSGDSSKIQDCGWHLQAEPMGVQPETAAAKRVEKVERRAKEKARRSYWGIMSKFQHDVMLKIVKIIDLVMITIPFALCWELYYSYLNLCKVWLGGQLGHDRSVCGVVLSVR